MQARWRRPAGPYAFAHAPMFATVLAAVACSSSGGGPSFESAAGDKDRVSVLGDGVDPSGGGTDPGDGRPPALSCRSPTDCPHGLCLFLSGGTSDGPSGGAEVGACFTLCAAPSGADLGTVSISNCARGSSCLVNAGVGVCLRPCQIDAECPRDRLVRLACTDVPGVPGHWCLIPKLSSVDTPPPPIDAG